MASLGVLLIFSIILSSIFKKMKLPGLIGMIISGIILGPNGLNIISKSILDISQTLRTMALIIILTRAGLTLDLKNLKDKKKEVIMLSFLPATFEMVAFMFISVLILKVSILEGLLIGSILSAVSPAVVVPRMIKIREEGYSKENGVPELILAGSSMDDVFVIVIFTSILSILKGKEISNLILLSVPISIILGILIGIIFGKLLNIIVNKVNNTSYIIVILYSLSFILFKLEEYILFSALISIMTVGIIINKGSPNKAKNLNKAYKEMWNIGEIILFSLLGTSIDINYIFDIGLISILIIIFILLVRMIGVFLSLSRSTLEKREKMFVAISYIPKATVQAAIGGIPLAEGLEIGNMALSYAVLSILITAPIGAILIDKTYKKLLS